MKIHTRTLKREHSCFPLRERRFKNEDTDTSMKITSLVPSNYLQIIHLMIVRTLTRIIKHFLQVRSYQTMKKNCKFLIMKL